MSKLNEILKSGRAPGVITGQRPFDPQSVYAKAPKAIAEIERTPRYKHGPNHSARDISLHFGMSTDFIRNTWRKPVVTAIAFVVGAFLCLSMNAGQIQSGGTLVDGQTVHASDLNNLVGNAVLLPACISAQPLQPFNYNDYGLFYSPVNGALYRATLLSVVQNPSMIQLLPAGIPVFTNADLFEFYSVANTNLESVTFSSLVSLVLSNANFSFFTFTATNTGNGYMTNILENWPGLFSGANTNNQPFSMWWGTNGIPYAQSLSNIEKAAAADMGTNWSLSYVFNQMFVPWTVYGTNGAFTNAWGETTNWPIFSLFTNNAAGAATNVPTLVDADTLPIKSTQQGSTNTTVTLNGLFQYMTNKNALPPYTIGRIQFNGNPVTETVTNMSATTGIITNLPDAANWTTPVAVSIQGKVSQIPTSPQVQSNTLYYVLLTNTTPIGFQLYTNYATAVARTNQILGNGVTPSATGNVLWLTNFTSVNADVIQVSSTTSIRTAFYDVYFRTTPSAFPFYYVSGSTLQASGFSPLVLCLASDSLLTTNFCRICTLNGGSGSGQDSSLVHVLIQPQ